MPRLLPLFAAFAAAALVAAGCGGGSSKHQDVPKTKGPVVPAEVTVPDEDATVTKDMGADGKTLLAAGCSFGTYPLQDQDMTNYHVSEDQLEWKTNPPSSGRHLDDWMPWGVYDEQVPDGNAVHNLEHGGVVVWLGDDIDDALTKAIDKEPKQGEKWVVSPRKGQSGITSAAWGYGLVCPAPSLAKLSTAQLTDGLRAWYVSVNSKGSPGEKTVPAYPGGVEDPAPVRDTSTDSPY